MLIQDEVLQMLEPEKDPIELQIMILELRSVKQMSADLIMMDEPYLLFSTFVRKSSCFE